MYEPDDAIYLIAVRSAAPKTGLEVRAVLEALKRDDVEVHAEVIAKRADEFDARHHDDLRSLGFEFDAANRILVVAAERAT